MPVVLEVECDAPAPFTATAAEGNAGVVSAPDALPLAEELLDGGEIVLLAIKPSLWFVLFDSMRWLLIGAVLMVIAFLPSVDLGSLSSESVMQLSLVVVAARLAIAFLRWVSRFYVLTNRRVMRMRGVFRVDMRACPLSSVARTHVSVGPHETLANLGTILIAAADVGNVDLHWYTVARPHEIHAQIRRAIERDSDSLPHS